MLVVVVGLLCPLCREDSEISLLLLYVTVQPQWL